MALINLIKFANLALLGVLHAQIKEIINVNHAIQVTISNQEIHAIHLVQVTLHVKIK